MRGSARCRAESCGREAVSQGLCHAHHSRGLAWIKKDPTERSWGSPGLVAAISGPISPKPTGIPRRRAVGGPSVVKATCRAPSCGEPIAVRGLCRTHYSRGREWIRADPARRSWDSPEALRVAMGEARSGSRSAPKAPGKLPRRAVREARERARLAQAEADKAQEVADREAVERARAERAAREGA